MSIGELCAVLHFLEDELNLQRVVAVFYRHRFIRRRCSLAGRLCVYLRGLRLLWLDVVFCVVWVVTLTYDSFALVSMICLISLCIDGLTGPIVGSVMLCSWRPLTYVCELIRKCRFKKAKRNPIEYLMEILN